MKINLEFDSWSEVMDFYKNFTVEVKKEQKTALESTNLPIRIINYLRKGGYDSVESVAAASDKELMRVRGIMDKSVKRIREEL